MLFKREIKRNYKSFLTVTLICAFFQVYIISMSLTFGADVKQILDMKMPPEFQKAIGMAGLNLNDPLGFTGIGFSYVYLFFSIAFASVFATIVSKEFSEKTAEYLFSLPVKRVNLLRTKILFSLTYVVSAALILFLATAIGMGAIIGGEIPWLTITLMTLAWILGGAALGSVAFLISSFFPRSRTASAVSMGVVLGMYLLQVVISMNKELDFLKYISPFDWYKGSEIINMNELSVVYSLIAIGISALCLFFGIRRFNRMDVLI
ncbi:MAG TPA: hypothetical protein DDX57_06650 [Bacteroidales bacterium]|nr:hypothetical protein [Bacteroidales bacterium]HCB63437.1 hypothetical protein [Bacteroidales bacterium]